MQTMRRAQSQIRSPWALGRSTFDHLFFPLCGNLLYFASSLDLLRLSFGHLYLICLRSPMRGVPLLCCLRRAFYNPSRCHGLSAFVWTCISFYSLVPWVLHLKCSIKRTHFADCS